MKPTTLQFVLESTEHPMRVMERFFPQGTTVLNRTTWLAKEPRSCGITNVKSRPHGTGENEATIYDIEVTYKPKGFINFAGATKYDGWTAMLLDRSKDGTLLDGHGQALPEGKPPVFLPLEVYKDVEFEELDFGDFVQETEVNGILHRGREEVLNEFYHSQSRGYSVSTRSTFFAHRRYRPLVKIVLVNGPSGVKTDGFGTRIVAINSFTPQLQQAILNELTKLISGFVEGKYSIHNTDNKECVFINIDRSFVDSTPNEEGKESRFDCLYEFVPKDFLEDVAKRLTSTYWIDVTIVDGPDGGLLLKALTPTED